MSKQNKQKNKTAARKQAKKNAPSIPKTIGGKAPHQQVFQK